jgi:hypothetical protein
MTVVASFEASSWYPYLRTEEQETSVVTDGSPAEI